MDDLVIAKDEETGKVSLRKVIHTFVRQAAPIVAVTITTAAGANETFNTTEEHPFWVQDIGWVQAGDLQSGYAVRTTTGGTAGVWSVAFTGQRTKVYNLEVEGLHNYHVGTSGVLVHITRCFSLISVRQLPDYHITRRPNKRGSAPRGSDGERIQIHHVDQNSNGPFAGMLATEHRRIANPRPGLTGLERKDFDAARRAYWSRQWDLGRFSGLPK